MRRKSNKIPKLHIRKHDKVMVLSGEYKGTIGEVLKMYPEKRKAIVEGVNIIKRHTKPNQQNKDGAIVEKEAAIPICKLQLIDPATGKPTRTGRIKTKKGWELISVKTKEIIKRQS